MAQQLVDQIMEIAKNMGLEEEHAYVPGHVDLIKKVVKMDEATKTNLRETIIKTYLKIKEGFYGSPEDLPESGLMVIPRDQIEATQLQDIIKYSGLHAEWDAREGYFFFPKKKNIMMSWREKSKH